MSDISLKPLIPIETRRMNLTVIQPDHAGDLFLLRADSELMKYIMKPVMLSIREAELMIVEFHKSIHLNTGIIWGIFNKNETKLAGTIGYHKIEWSNRRAEVGYMLGQAYHNKGLMTEALESVIQVGFERFKFHSVEARVSPDNQSSVKVLENCGFRQEGHLQENVFFNNRYSGSLIYSKLSNI